jgi:hypothetical protein
MAVIAIDWTERSTAVSKTLTFLHTSPAHIATFDRLCSELAPGVPTRHIVDESLLRDAREARTITPDLAQRVSRTVSDAAEAGAGMILCTCSTIGGCAEDAGRAMAQPVMRVDRAMAERAVAIGDRIVVAAALASTVIPTRQLILDTASAAGRQVTITAITCEDAWAHFERGDQSLYLQAIAAALRSAADAGDVIVLAQASMADAALLCADLPVPILSSPRLGLEAALAEYARQCEPGHDQ